MGEGTGAVGDWGGTPGSGLTRHRPGPAVPGAVGLRVREAPPQPRVWPGRGLRGEAPVVPTVRRDRTGGAPRVRAARGELGRPVRFGAAGALQAGGLGLVW